jgi:AbrB family looped-hinge helix DNA binding protein
MVLIRESIEKLMKVHGGNKVTLPKKICERMDIKDGDVVLIKIDNENIIVTPSKVVPKA